MHLVPGPAEAGRHECRRIRFAVAVFMFVALVMGTTLLAVDLTGKWTFNVETSGGSGTPTFTFKQEGEKLTGHYSGQLGEADLTGSVKGQDVTFSFTVDVQGNHVEVTYTGKSTDANSIKGTVSLGEFATGTFTGKRQ